MYFFFHSGPLFWSPQLTSGFMCLKEYWLFFFLFPSCPFFLSLSLFFFVSVQFSLVFLLFFFFFPFSLFIFFSFSLLLFFFLSAFNFIPFFLSSRWCAVCVQVGNKQSVVETLKGPSASRCICTACEGQPGTTVHGRWTENRRLLGCCWLARCCRGLRGCNLLKVTL